MYAWHLRIPMFNPYEEVSRKPKRDKGFYDFLASLMHMGLENRQEDDRKRKSHSARFPYSKISEEFYFSCLNHVSEVQIRPLASYDHQPCHRKNHCSIALGLKAVCRDWMCDSTQRPICPNGKQIQRQSLPIFTRYTTLVGTNCYL